MNSLSPMTKPFNYELVPAGSRDIVMEYVASIRSRIDRQKSDIIAMGHDLLKAKEAVGHGNFLPWISSEFGMTARTAQKYMAAAEWVGDENESGSLLPPTLIYALTDKRTPEAIQAEVKSDLIAGKPVDIPAIKGKIKEAHEQHRREAKVQKRQATVSPANPAQHPAEQHFGPLSGGEWMYLAWDCRRSTGRGKNRRHFYSDEFMKLVAFHSVPIQDLEAAE
jgi:hypothetical protein